MKNCILISSFLIFFNHTINSQTITFNRIDFPKSINIEDLDKFSEGIKESCANNFYLKLIENKFYPQFGTINSWKTICLEIKTINKINLEFVKKNFFPITRQTKTGILTGYYEPEIDISEKQTNKYKYPILKKSHNLNYERKEIMKKYSKVNVLYWADNKIDLFFLHVQGSGIGVLPNGKRVKLAYAGNNGFMYTSIGKVLIKKKAIKKEDISLKSIKVWLEKNPNEVDNIFNYNKRFIFFTENHDLNNYPKGAMNTELIPKISIAIDNSIYPYGLPFLLKLNKREYIKLVLAHDTGSAIKGYNRADLFIGRGEESGEIAGNLKEFLELYVLVPYN
ncbi:MltA domain-containing protein [Rickettsiales bacterium]|nr:MltA domain-containing protein [Rickettsiales bacterium]